nr:DUF2913 family protein [Motilimonas cestriensis]
MLSQLSTHSLLHLYFEVATSSGFVPVAKRNAIINKYLKGQLALPVYRPIKKDIKSLIAHGRRLNGDAEAELTKLHKITRQSTQENDVDHLYSLLAKVEANHGIKSDLVHDDEHPKMADVLYLLPEHIEHCFDEEGNQIAPISVLLESLKHNEIMDLVEGSGSFKVGLVEVNEANHQAHYQLHPATVTL